MQERIENVFLFAIWWLGACFRDEYFTNDNDQKLTIFDFAVIVKIKWSEQSGRLLVRQILACFHHPLLELSVTYFARAIEIIILSFTF